MTEVRLVLRGYRAASWNRKGVTGWTRQRLAAEAHAHVLAALALLRDRPACIRGPFTVVAVGRFAGRPLDPDNLRLKPVIDALRREGLIEDDDYTRLRRLMVRCEKAVTADDELELVIRPLGPAVACSAQLLREADRLRWEVGRLVQYAAELRRRLAERGEDAPGPDDDEHDPFSVALAWRPPAAAAPCGCVAWCELAGEVSA